jgi:hypothetical protein
MSSFQTRIDQCTTLPLQIRMMFSVGSGHTRQFVSDSKFVSKFAFHDYNSGISPVCLPRTSFTVIVGQFICQFVDQHSGFYSWSTFPSSPSVADDVGVLFENDRRQRECLYKSLKLIVMKPVVSKCNFLCQKCAKTHLRAFVTSTHFPGASPPDPQH